MIYDVIERVVTVLEANFKTDFDALASAAGVNTLTVPIRKRLAMEHFHHLGPVGIGVYHDGGSSARRKAGAGSDAAVRDSEVRVILDWYLRGSQPSVVAVQTELAVAAMMRSVDEIPSGLVWSAADAQQSVTWRITRGPLTDAERVAEERALLEFPVMVREEGL